MIWTSLYALLVILAFGLSLFGLVKKNGEAQAIAVLLVCLALLVNGIR